MSSFSLTFFCKLLDIYGLKAIKKQTRTLQLLIQSVTGFLEPADKQLFMIPVQSRITDKGIHFTSLI